MKKRLLLLGVYFSLAPIFLLTLIFYQLFLHDQNSQVSAKILNANSTKTSYNTIQAPIQTTVVTTSAHEARVDVLKQFFGRYSSPLADYSTQIVDAADKYGLDYRLLPAIAMQESTLCQKIPKNSFNCWGFGIYGGKITRFGDYGEAIETISKTLARDYHNNGLKNPEEIMSKYTPSSNGSWAENVNYVMDRIASSL